MSNEKDKGLGDLLKKVVSSNTIENLGGLLESAKNTKDDIVGLAKGELKNYLEKINITKEIDRILETYDIEVKGTLSFKKKKDAATKTSKSTKNSESDEE